ncbi:MAG: Arm DNA-binding domain-containing protein [Planctomycetota bacterium]
MKFQFTKTKLEALVPPAKGRTYYQDAGGESLSICITAAGSRTFYLVRFFRGEKVRIPLGKFPTLSVEQARKACRGIVGKLADGIDVQAARQADRAEATLKELFASYLELHAKPQKRSWAEDERQFGK